MGQAVEDDLPAPEPLYFYASAKGGFPRRKMREAQALASPLFDAPQASRPRAARYSDALRPDTFRRSAARKGESPEGAKRSGALREARLTDRARCKVGGLGTTKQKLRRRRSALSIGRFQWLGQGRVGRAVKGCWGRNRWPCGSGQ